MAGQALQGAGGANGCVNGLQPRPEPPLTGQCEDHELHSMSKILIVDDQKSLRDLLREVLHDLDLPEVDEAADGEAALAKLGAGPYELMISDWNMPNMNGIQLLRAVRANPSLRALPVIMLTGESAREQVIEAIKLGVSGFIKKPFNPTDLAVAVRRAIPEPEKTG